jgi:AraC family ethanolamine operon transcriptional activator
MASPSERTIADQALAEPWFLASASDDVDGHCANLGRWRLDYDQISRGAFKGSFTEVRLPHLQVFRETTSQKVRQYGRLGADSYGIGLPWNGHGDVNFNGSSMSAGNVIASFDAEVDLCTPPEFELRGVVMDASLIEGALAAMNIELKSGVWHRLRELQMAPGPAARIRQMLQLVQEVVDDTPWVLSEPAARQHLEDSLLGEILEMLPTVQPCDDIKGGQARKRVVDRACELMLSRPDQPMSVLDVCKGVGASRRKLNNYFLEVLATNPVNYLRAVRLNKVRRELKCCVDERIGVYDIAVKWGFWHFSQFSLDYKRHFAELPSETLRRSRLRGASDRGLIAAGNGGTWLDGYRRRQRNGRAALSR